MCICYDEKPEDFKTKKNVQGSDGEKCMESCESLCKEAKTKYFGISCTKLS